MYDGGEEAFILISFRSLGMQRFDLTRVVAQRKQKRCPQRLFELSRSLGNRREARGPNIDSEVSTKATP